MAQAKAGDRHAQALLCRRHWRTVQGLARKIAGSTEGEDVAQDVFALVFKSLDALRDASAFRSWVCGITARMARRQHRRRNARQLILAEYGAQPARHWDDLLPAEAALELKEVSTRLARLRARHRDAVRLHRLEGRTSGETARAMGASLSSVKRWLAQVDQRLKAGASWTT